jgi:hypothetical protein
MSGNLLLIAAIQSLNWDVKSKTDRNAQNHLLFVLYRSARSGAADQTLRKGLKRK